MSEAYTGGCACGAIRYEISAEPMFDERLPVPRLPAQERHRARILPDLPEQGGVKLRAKQRIGTSSATAAT